MAQRVNRPASRADVHPVAEFSTREVLRVIVSNSCLQQ
jgi:hypothetical protein